MTTKPTEGYLDRLRGKIRKHRELERKKPAKTIFKIIVFSCGCLFSEMAHKCARAVKRAALPPGRGSEKFRVVFYLIGGVGDIAINANYIEHFSAIDPDGCEIHILTDKPDAVRGIFFKKKYIAAISENLPDLSEFSAVLTLIRYPIVNRLEPSARAKSPKVFDYLKRVEKFNEERPSTRLWAYPADFFSTNFEITVGGSRVAQPDAGGVLRISPSLFSLEYDKSAEAVLDEYGLEKSGYLTVQRGSQEGAEATKILSLEQYGAFLRGLKKLRPQLRLVQLGRADTAPLETDVDLRGKTDFEQLKALLKHSLFHIDCECGMVHMKHFLGGKSVVFFGPTPAAYMGYPENLNIEGGVCKGRFCEWMTPDWREKCPLTGGRAACMESIDVAAALVALERSGLLERA